MRGNIALPALADETRCAMVLVAPKTPRRSGPSDKSKLESNMLTYKDCLDWSDIDQNEVDAISEHEQMDRIVALAYGDRLAHQPDGNRMMRRIMINDIRHAQTMHNGIHEAELRRVLNQYIKTHPI